MRYLLTAALMAGCYDYDEKPDGASDLDEAEAYAVTKVDVDLCADTPGPRSYAHAASFVTSTPLALEDVSPPVYTDRGFLVHGGLDGLVLDDVWIYDLSTPPELACPWHLVSSSSGLARYGGAFGYDPATESFLLVGGVEDDGTTEAAVSTAERLDLRDIAAGFTTIGLLPELVYSFEEVGDPSCEGTFDFKIRIVDSCGSLGTVERCAVAADFDQEETGIWHDYQCDMDPGCFSSEAEVGFSVTAPGLWGSAAVMDADNGVLYVMGGTTGCEGASCGAWADLFAADTTGEPSLQAANARTLFAVTATGITELGPLELDSLAPDEGTWPWYDSSAWEWPAQAGSGFRHASAVDTAQTWSLANRAWSTPSAGPSPVLFGGSRHQDTSPARQFTHTCTATDPACGFCSHWEHAWGAYPNPHSDTSDGLEVHAGAGSINIDLLLWSAVALSPELPGLAGAGAAVLAPGESMSVLAGGIDRWTASGTSEARIVNHATGVVTSAALVDSIGPRRGISAVSDPVAQTVFLYGGHTTSDEVFVVTGPQTRSTGSSSTLAMSGIDVDLALDAASGDWTATQSFTLTNTCGGSECVATTVPIILPFGDPNDAWDAVVTFEVGGTAYEVPVLDVDTETVGSDTYNVVTVAMPRYLPDGASIPVSVAWTSTGLTPVDNLALALNYDVPTTANLHGVASYAFGALPATVRSSGSVSDTYQSLFLAVDSLEVDAPKGYTVVAAGTRDTAGATFTNIPAANPFWATTVLLLPTPTATGTVTSAAGKTVRVYEDPAFATTASTAAVASYVSGSGQTLSADLAFYESHWPDLDREHTVVFWSPEAAMPSVAGATVPGISVVQCFDPSGAPFAGTECTLEWTAAHELAHVWFGVRTRFTEGASWVLEGLPTLVSESLHPDDVWDPFREKGLLELIRIESAGDWDVTTYESRFDLSYYYPSAYLLTLYHHMGMAAGSTTSEARWDAWGAFLTAYDGEVADPDEVAAHIQAQPGGTSFYSQYVSTGKRGVPVLVLTDFGCDGAAGGDTGDTGADTGDPCAFATADIQQIQGEHWGFDTFSDVPYYLGCHPDADETVTAFLGCEATAQALQTSVPRTTSALSESLTLAADSTLSVAAMPVSVGVITNDMLLPDATPTFGIQLRTWRSWCTPGDTSGWCGVDDDTDGYPSFTDCHDFDPGIHPGPAETTHNGTDYNCDGWATP